MAAVQDHFEPQIMAFCCNYCACAAKMTEETRRLGPSGKPCKNQANTVHAGEVAVHD